MSKTKFNVALWAAIIGLAACTTTPVKMPELEAARAQVEQVSVDPMADEAAGTTVRQAKEALAAADAASQKRAPIEQIKQSAYEAQRYADIARAQIKEAHARKEIADSEAQRTKVLLTAREREASTAIAQAQASKTAADAARSDADAARAQAEAARTQAQQAQSEADALRAAMDELQAKPTERGMVLTLGDVLFDTAQSTLKPGAEMTLNRLAEFMRSHEGFAIMVEGHTDSRGGDEYNLGLSQRRAQAVQSALVSRGIDGSRIRTQGYGKAYPVASNDDNAGRQQNRRVEIVFSDDKGQFVNGAQRSAAR